jgi:hypothetical protein
MMFRWRAPNYLWPLNEVEYAGGPAAGVLLLQVAEQAAEPWAMVQFGV